MPRPEIGELSLRRFCDTDMFHRIKWAIFLPLALMFAVWVAIAGYYSFGCGSDGWGYALAPMIMFVIAVPWVSAMAVLGNLAAILASFSIEPYMLLRRGTSVIGMGAAVPVGLFVVAT
ncbi:MAG: hypothetical protein VYB88_17650 [Pseudomonadota bacterium]|nr:hypothetical protein [Pseudomonadota bacterium]